MSPRIKAFLIHSLFSIVLALLIVGLIFFVWYPAPLAQAIGVTQIFLIMLAIDVIVGPLFTLLVYKKGKKTLIFDLAVIVLLQLSAFAYGLWTVFQGRPVWIVFNADRFDIVRVNEIDTRQISKAKSEYQKPSWFFPQWVAAVPPKDINENNKITFEAVFAGVDIAQRPNLFVPLSHEKEHIKDKVFETSQLYKFNNKQEVKRVLIKYSQANAWLPLKANKIDMVVLINKNTGQVVKIVDLRPWN